MSAISLLVLMVLAWLLYRVVISGPGGKRSFLQFYRDQNEVRHDIQSRGGIHNVESTNIKNLENKGYEVSEYGENFVSLKMKNEYGKSELSVINGKNRKSLKIEFKNLSDKKILNDKRKMRSSNGALSTLSRYLKEVLQNSDMLNSDSKIQILNHFRGGTTETPDEAII